MAESSPSPGERRSLPTKRPWRERTPSSTRGTRSSKARRLEHPLESPFTDPFPLSSTRRGTASNLFRRFGAQEDTQDDTQDKDNLHIDSASGNSSDQENSRPLLEDSSPSLSPPRLSLMIADDDEEPVSRPATPRLVEMDGLFQLASLPETVTSTQDSQNVTSKESGDKDPSQTVLVQWQINREACEMFLVLPGYHITADWFKNQMLERYAPIEYCKPELVIDVSLTLDVGIICSECLSSL